MTRIVRSVTNCDALLKNSFIMQFFLTGRSGERLQSVGIGVDWPLEIVDSSATLDNVKKH